jgi:predicted nucleotidyltransferase
MGTTQVQLTDEQARKLAKLAEEEGVSVVELIKRSIDLYVQEHEMIGTAEQRRRALAIAGRYNSGLSDVSEKHDEYLAEIYGDFLYEQQPSDYWRSQREIILTIAQQHGASNVQVFGSAIRGEATAASDLDLLVEMEPSHSLLDRIALIQDLEDALGISVDVVTEKGLHPAMRDEVLSQAQPL